MRKQAACIATITSVFVLAISMVGQTSRSTSESGVFLARVAGVYKMQFQNGFVGGEKYQSEDILEVLPVDEHAAYVRMDIEFFNGHSGSIYGIATYGKNSLIYDNGKPGDEACVVEYIWSAEKIVTKADYEKTPGCTYYHGARGSLDRVEFLVKKKQTIHYMQRLRDSQQFKDAMDEYRKKRR